MLTIWLGLWQVAYVRDSDSQEPADNFFVPGPWIDEVLPHQHEAHEALAAASARNAEKERQALRAQLLVGVPQQECNCTLDQHCPICDAAAAEVYDDEGAAPIPAGYEDLTRAEIDELRAESVKPDFTQKELDNQDRTEVWNNPSVKDQLWEEHQ